jgi:hypothetical protein
VHRRRTLVGLRLMAAQAFLYNAIFFFASAAVSSAYLTASEPFPWKSARQN